MPADQRMASPFIALADPDGALEGFPHFGVEFLYIERPPLGQLIIELRAAGQIDTEAVGTAHVNR